MILSKFSKRERALFTAAAVVVAAVVFYGLILEPFMRANNALNQKIETVLMKLKKAQTMLSRRDEIGAEYGRFAAFIRPSASDEEEQAAMLKVLEAVARANDMRILNMRPQPVIDKGYYRNLIFELHVEADMDRLLKFIYVLHTSGNLLRVTKLTMSNSSKASGLKAVVEVDRPLFQIKK